MRRCSALLATLLAAITVFAIPARGATPREYSCDIQNALCAGQSLYSTKHIVWMLQSADRRFLLGLAGSELWLSDVETRRSGRTESDLAWRINKPTYDTSRHDGTLSMQRNGNLVLRTHNGTVEWTSHTAGTGRHNQLILHNSGNLVVRTGSGKVVWSSHTGRDILLPGQQLASGQRLINRTGTGTLPIRLTMTRAGDLVLKHGSQRTWHSNTHAAGSALRFRPNGRLVIVTPRGKVVWHTAAFGKGSWVRLIMGGWFEVQKGTNCWSRPHGNGCTLR